MITQYRNAFASLLRSSVTGLSKGSHKRNGELNHLPDPQGSKQPGQGTVQPPVLPVSTALAWVRLHHNDYLGEQGEKRDCPPPSLKRQAASEYRT